jgi:DNA polymerase-1
MLFKLLEEHQPDYVAAIFDTGGATFRNELYAKYKAHRPPCPEDLEPQFPLIYRAVQAFRLPLLAVDGFEADDVIATLARVGDAAGIDVVVVSSDKDLMQLAGPRIRLLDTMKGRFFGPAEVKEKFGVLPEALGDWLALVGDTSDNVPGIPGVGPKSATKLLEAYGDLEGVLAAASVVSGAKLRSNLIEYADQARLSRKLVALRDDVPLSQTLGDLARKTLDASALRELFAELNLDRLLTKVSSDNSSCVLDRARYLTVLAEAQLRTVVDEIRQARRFAFDLETTSLDAMSAEIVGIALCWGPNRACYVPVGHRYLGRPAQLSLALVLEQLAPLLTDPDLPKVGQNAKYDWLVLRQAGVDVRGIVGDPMLISYVLDPSRMSHGLDALAQDHLGHTMISFREVAGREGAFDQVEIDAATRYAAEDADATYRLADLLAEQLVQQKSLKKLFDEVELPLSRILGEMEHHGCAVDVARLQEINREVGKALVEVERAIWAEAGWEININSSKQLQQLLYQTLGLKAERKTKTGFSTSADVLADLAIEYPIAAQILEYRTLYKLRSTYLETLPTLVNKRTGRIHTSFNQAVAATGRLSSSDPNLQNIPIRTDIGRQIREAFVAPPGKVLLSADYSQVELRVLAHLCHDALLVDSFKRGEDVHTRTAMEVFGVKQEQVNSEHRRVAKAVNFGVIYGQSDWGLARQLRIPKAEARRYIDEYFERYAGVRLYMEQLIAEARQRGEVLTLLGRRRPIPEINSSSFRLRGNAERMARNTPIQGTAADLIKLAMIRVDQELKLHRLDAQMILTVHDEIVLEVAPKHLDQVQRIVPEAMAHVIELDVPLQVDVGVGQNWAEAH